MPSESQPELFLLDPANADFVAHKDRRPASWNRTPGCLVLFLIPLALMGLPLVFIAINVWNDWSLLHNSGVPVQAHVVNKHILSDAEEGDSYNIIYRFTYEAKDYSRQENVTQAIYNSLENGSVMPVIFVPSSPNIFRLAIHVSASPPWYLIPLVILWNGACWLAIVFFIGRGRRVNYTAAHGQLIQGELLSCHGSTNQAGVYQVMVEYRFHVPTTDAEIICTATSGGRGDLRDKPAPPPGTRVAVLFADMAHVELL